MYDQFPFLSRSMRRALPFTASSPVAARKAVRLFASSAGTQAGGTQLQPTRKLKYRSLFEPSGVGNGAETWYRPISRGTTIVMTSVPMSPKFVDAISAGMAGGFADRKSTRLN